METNQMEITQIEVNQADALIEAPQVFRPWRRFLARSIDVSLHEFLWTAFLGLVFNVGLMSRSTWETLLDTYIAILLMLFLEPIFLHLLGTTPGKAIFGLRVKHADDRNLTYSEGFHRTWGLIGSGIGYNIPIYNLIRLWKSYVSCKEKQVSPWDESVSYTIKDTKWYRWLLLIGVNLIILALLFTLYEYQILAPNRGDLTVAQFAENYNYYEKLLDADFDNIYMNEKGEWAEKNVPGVLYVPIYYSAHPEIAFQMEGDYVKGVTLKHESTGRKDFIDSHSSQMALAALALSGAQKEVGIFSRIPENILKQMNPNFQSFQFTEAGITFTCDIQYSGYEYVGHHFLIPIEHSTGYDYHFIFSMEKVNGRGD